VGQCLDIWHVGVQNRGASQVAVLAVGMVCTTLVAQVVVCQACLACGLVIMLVVTKVLLGRDTGFVRAVGCCRTPGHLERHNKKEERKHPTKHDSNSSLAPIDPRWRGLSKQPWVGVCRYSQPRHARRKRIRGQMEAACSSSEALGRQKSRTLCDSKGDSCSVWAASQVLLVQVEPRIKSAWQAPAALLKACGPNLAQARIVSIRRDAWQAPSARPRGLST